MTEASPYACGIYRRPCCSTCASRPSSVAMRGGWRTISGWARTAGPDLMRSCMKLGFASKGKPPSYGTWPSWLRWERSERAIDWPRQDTRSQPYAPCVACLTRCGAGSISANARRYERQGPEQLHPEPSRWPEPRVATLCRDGHIRQPSPDIPAAGV